MRLVALKWGEFWAAWDKAFTRDCRTRDGLERGVSEQGERLGVYCVAQMRNDESVDWMWQFQTPR